MLMAVVHTIASILYFDFQTEDEALAQAIQMSMAESSQPQTQPSKP